MQAEPRRVALLARPGAARDRLRAMLDEAGVACVLDADPTAVGVSALVDADPNVVLIAIDAATEDVLERFDSVIGNSSVDVIFEEAEFVVSRQGWDAARWQRHLVAKLQRHGDVLPPAPMGENDAGESIALPEDDSFSFADIADEFAHSPDEAVEEAVAEAVAEASAHTGDGLIDGAERGELTGPQELSADIAGVGLMARTVESEPHPFDPAGDYDYDSTPIEAEVAGFGLEGRADESAPPHAAAFDPAAFDGASFDTPSFEPTAFANDSFDAGTSFETPSFDATNFDPSAFDSVDFDAPAFGDTHPPAAAANDAGGDAEAGTFAPSLDAGAESAPASTASRAGGMELTLDDGSADFAPESEAVAGRFRHDLEDLHARISTLELVDDTPRRGPEQARGAVLVLAGIGGPDAVRQLLGALPEGFPRPVLVQQRLEGGRYDKLVAQMQRATSLSVRLAEAGSQALGGIVYILPDTVGVESQGDTLRFTGVAGNVLSALPAADSAVLMFSGSDPTLVDAAMNHSWSGALVAGQSPDGCYDATAPAALLARGAEAAPPAELALRLAARWTH